MKTLGFLAGAVLTANLAGAQARSGEDVAAWYGMMLTPVGAFPTMEPSSGFTLRASRWNDRAVANVGQTSFGLAYRPHAAAGIQYDVTAGWVHSDASRLRDGTGLIGASA